MAQSIILNRNNIVAGSNNSVFRYQLPKLTSFQNMEIGVKSIDMYNSIFNINASLYNNHRFQYYWFNATGTLSTLHTITIPDGFYDTVSLNEFLYAQLIINTHYLISTENKYLFFLKMSDNINRYGIQLDCQITYTNDQAIAGILLNGITYKYPTTRTGSWQFPSSTPLTPRFKFPTTSNFHVIIGYDQAEYPSANRTVSQSFLSTTVPMQSPVSSVIVLCNLVRNELCNPETLLHSFILNADFGYLNSERPNETSYLPITNGSYNTIELRFQDQDLRPIQIRDPQILINLLLRQK
jgi:hypothetical protein